MTGKVKGNTFLKCDISKYIVILFIWYSNIKITLDTRIHLFENIDHGAVAQLDDVF